MGAGHMSSRVPDPMWKRDPDWVASESFHDRFLPDDEIEEDEFEEEERDDEDAIPYYPYWASSIYARNNKGGFR